MDVVNKIVADTANETTLYFADCLWSMFIVVDMLMLPQNNLVGFEEYGDILSLTRRKKECSHCVSILLSREMERMKGQLP